MNARLQTQEWSPARLFMLISALYHLPLGIVGLFYDRTFPIGSAETLRSGSAHIWGLLETNGWHSLAALLIGVVSAYFALRPRGAYVTAWVIGVMHVQLTIALIVWPPETFWIASNNGDQVIHIATATAAIAAALLTRFNRTNPDRGGVTRAAEASG